MPKKKKRPDETIALQHYDAAGAAVDELDDAECRELLAVFVARHMAASGETPRQSIDGANSWPVRRQFLEGRTEMECPNCKSLARLTVVGKSWVTDCQGCGFSSVVGKVSSPLPRKAAQRV
jgi:hypothetical protein